MTVVATVVFVRAARERPLPRKVIIILGIAGKIASGKSVIADYLRDNDWHVVNADELGHRLLEQVDVKSALSERFGEDILDARGEIKRSVLAGRALAQEDGMAFVNELLWPRIGELIPSELSAATGDAVLEAAVMLQAGWQEHVDKVILVRAPRELRMRRALEAGGQADQLEWMAELQESYLNIEVGADYVLENVADPAALIKQLGRLPEVKEYLR